jgi:serine/threonine protein kinase
MEGEARKLVFGLYVLVDRLGSGSLGPVYRATGISDRCSYLLKFLPKRDQWNIRLVRQQINAFSHLPAHPGVVPFLDVGSAHGVHYLVWPFAEGQNLESMVREYGPILPGEIARIGTRVAEALKICHQSQLVHGLIKPSNILLGVNGQIQVLDFGIGALLADNGDDDVVDTVTRAEALARMLECAAPESVADSTKWTPFGDQYSLGCSLYFAGTGRFPFAGGTFVDKVIAHQRQKPTSIITLNPDIPPPLARIIDRLMSKSPLERYRRWEEVIDELGKLANRAPATRPVSVDVQTPKPKRKLGLNPASEDGASEASLIELPRKGGFWSRLSPFKRKAQELQISVFGPMAAQPGQTVVLHLYAHETRDEGELLRLAEGLENPPHWLGSANLPGQFSKKSWIGLRFLAKGFTVGEENQEIEWESPMVMRKVSILVPKNSYAEMIPCEVLIGTDNGAGGELKFAFPVLKRR